MPLSQEQIDDVFDSFGDKPNGGAAEMPLPYVDLSLPITPREWLVPERIPMRNVSMLGGDGSIGKSLLLMQLSGAVVLGKDWIGTLPEQGSALYMSCEEDDDEVRRRMEDVAQHLGSSREDMIECGLRFLSFAGKDAVLAVPDRQGIMRPAPLLERLRRDALQLRPKLIAIDTIADTFGGKENDRSQTRQFITMLRGLAIEAGAAVVLCAHPSLTGISTDTGLSGNTGWHNSVRARMYFKPAPGDDTSLRVLEVKKNNYGPVNESILLRWRDGVYVIEPRQGSLERLASDAEFDNLFLKLLRRLTGQGRNVTDKKGTSFAPATFADEPEAKNAKADKKALADAMRRLFAANKIKVITEGPASKLRTRIVELEGQDAGASTNPSTNVPPPSHHPSTNVPPLSPHTPLLGGTGLGLVETPARSTRPEEGKTAKSRDQTPIALTGGPAVLVRHSAYLGRRRETIRRFEVTVPHRYAQYDATVLIWYLPPKKRRLRGCQILPGHLEFCTIERNGSVIYDSRTDVPCDMVEWERCHEEAKTEWKREKAEYAVRYAGMGIRTGHERPEFDE